MTAVAAAVTAGCALVAAVLALATWVDGSPQPWFSISAVAAPLGLVAGAVAWIRDRNRTRVARAATGVGALVSIFWLFVLASLITGAR